MVARSARERLASQRATRLQALRGAGGWPRYIRETALVVLKEAVEMDDDVTDLSTCARSTADMALLGHTREARRLRNAGGLRWYLIDYTRLAGRRVFLPCLWRILDEHPLS
jgi:hypothetical protein